eukprot:TRINITY_DN6525_c0_g1_i1.p2 TRINITY_DN6525_c0_g1~~TRINITY_DN6525_c0_g1_i1.p2  ORF type:complete len:611 (+),score=-96.32 TRINITY_DN6525_c0_g1_i1:4158-5990(+)
MRDFFPLTVNYQERAYAAGKIPGGYFKREGRPTEKEVLASRLIDRAIRPLFPKGFFCEVQILATLKSLDPEIPVEVPALIGAAAALGISGLPFQGPLAAARVGYWDGAYHLNPASSRLSDSDLDLVVAGTRAGVIMVESQAKALPEETMLQAVLYGQAQLQTAIEAVERFVSKAQSRSWDWTPPVINTALVDEVARVAKQGLQEAYAIQEKGERVKKVQSVRAQVIADLGQTGETTNVSEIAHILHELERDIVRGKILSGEQRIDGRSTEDIRPISCETTVFPRTHGSAIFTRGETQAIVTCTLGTAQDAQMVDDLSSGESREHFLFHYNFPPFSVGEVGFLGSPKRREIGHGRLARRALEAVLPASETFPYVLRIVSEITESNGSSSMASVCGATLALMDAGVPVSAPVAGIAMGLIKDEERYAVLSDILGDEDHLGDMDFKVAGTAQGVTALQMDIKIPGVVCEILRIALEQARAGRLHILEKMLATLPEHRQEISSYAPRIRTIQISPAKIRDVIGKGGATIRELSERTNTVIDISDNGIVKIASSDQLGLQQAVEQIQAITAEVELGKVYPAKVVKIVDFGAFLEVLPESKGYYIYRRLPQSTWKM